MVEIVKACRNNYGRSLWLKGYIYKIENDVNGKYYLGSTINPESRMMHHFAALRSGKHHSRHLQRAFDKYGEEHFHFCIIEECDAEDRISVEQKYLDSMDLSTEMFYNVSPVASNCVLVGEKNGMWGRRGEDNPNFGRKNTKESIERMSAIHKGRPKTLEHRKHLSESKKKMYASGELVSWNKGAHLTEEQKKHLSDVKKKPIVYYRLDNGEYVGEFPSRFEAEELLRISKESIYSVCKRKAKSTKGFIWRFKDDVYNSDLKNIYEIEDRPKRKPRTNKRL